MGTPHFAVPTLEALLNRCHLAHSPNITQEKNYKLIGVYTKPPTPLGRGLRTFLSPIHQLAEKHLLPVYTPSTFRDEGAVEQFRSLNPDLVVVVAYGLILRKKVLEIPHYGCINLHPSALPRWRGAAPIERTIMSGDTATDICIMKMDEGMDTGPVILRKSLIIDEKITGGILKERASIIGAKMMLEAIDLVISGKANYKEQDNLGATLAYKLTKEDEKIDWSQSARGIHCKIRALAPKPGAYFLHKNQLIKILEADYIPGNRAFTDIPSHFLEKSEILQPGIVLDGQEFIGQRGINGTEITQSNFTKTLIIGCGDGGWLLPKLLQRLGGKIIETKDFLNGNNITSDTILG